MPGMDIGHVHLRVSDLDRSVAFYRDVLGFELRGQLSIGVAFLADGDYHHHIALNTFESAGGPPPPAGSTGLFHFAIRFDDQDEFLAVLRRVLDAGVEITSVRDHGANEAVYFDDPDGNGVELCLDRPPADWPRTPDGQLLVLNDPLELDALLARA